jgi:hypothetical protein
MPVNGIPVATGSNRVNSSGASLGTVKARSSITINNIVPANSTLQVPATGTQFYVIIQTAPVAIRPSGGVFNVYEQGTGLQLEEINAFQLLEIKNDNAFPVVFSLFVGFDQFIDNRLILSATGEMLVARPTYPTASAGIAVDINDISGAAFTDINGNGWYALNREAIYVFNPAPGVPLLLQAAGSAISNGPAVAVIYPTTSLRYAASGDYSISVGGGNINAIVSELYNAIPA